MVDKQKSEKYILKQKEKYAKKINKTQHFISAYKEAYKKGDLKIFWDFLIEIEKRTEFIKESEEILYERKLDKYNLDNLREFTVNLGINELESRYGSKLGDKLKNLYLKEKITMFDVEKLVDINVEKKMLNKEERLSEREAIRLREKKGEQLCSLLDLFTNDKLAVGIHLTGCEGLGKKIKEEGLNLTGHLSSGVANNVVTDLDVTLERNISFYSSPGFSISQICGGGHYKNYWGSELVDVVLVGIPKEKIENNEYGILSYESNILRLKPEYVLGYVTVNSKSNTINDIKMEERGREYENNTTNVENPTQMYIKRLKKCLDIATKDPEYEVIKGNFINFCKRLKGKEKDINAKGKSQMQREGRE